METALGEPLAWIIANPQTVYRIIINALFAYFLYSILRFPGSGGDDDGDDDGGSGFLEFLGLRDGDGKRKRRKRFAHH